MFNLGQRVFSASFGEGVVTEIGASTEMYPVAVTFDNHTKETFTLEGKQFVLQEVPVLAPMPETPDALQMEHQYE